MRKKSTARRNWFLVTALLLGVASCNDKDSNSPIPDGSILISDDANGTIWRVRYKG